MGLAQGHGGLLLVMGITDTPTSNPTFSMSTERLGVEANVVVQSWGAFANAVNVPVNDSSITGDVTLLANAFMIPSGGTVRKTVAEWLRILPIRDAGVLLYQVDPLSVDTFVIWSGFVEGVSRSYLERGAHLIDLAFAPIPRLRRNPISDVVTPAAFPTSPRNVFGGMVPRLYGFADNITNNNGNLGSPAIVGMPMHGARGVIIDENQATTAIKIRFGKHDGTSTSHQFAEPTVDDPSTAGGLWIYDAQARAYGMVDASSWSFTNDTSKLEVVVDASPKVFFFIKPSELGGESAGGLTDLNKLTDSDPNNFSVSTSTDYKWAFKAPQFSTNGLVKGVGVCVDWLNNGGAGGDARKIRFGLWDSVDQVSARYLSHASVTGGRYAEDAMLFGINRRITMQNVADATSASPSFERYTNTWWIRGGGSDTTISDFIHGRFVSADAANNRIPVQLKVEVIDLGGADAGTDGVQIYSISMYVEVSYPSRQRIQDWLNKPEPPSGWNQPWSKPAHIQQKYPWFFDRFAAEPGAEATQFFARGAFQKDDGAGTYTGTANAAMVRPCDIAYHLLNKVAGQSVNVTAGTLGNFIDPRS